jgi:hypothetical protein
VFKKFSLSVVTAFLAYSHNVLGQAPSERIIQPIIINGQSAQGAFVVTPNGTIQSQTCSSPQQYVTVDQSSSGWACFEVSTGTWLLQAQPPRQSAAPRPTTVYSRPSAVYVPAPAIPTYSYPYGYYPYPYYPYYASPYFVGPRFGFGFGFGFGVRSPMIVSRPFVSRPLIGRPVAPFGISRSYVGGFRRGRAVMAFGRVGRR